MTAPRRPGVKLDSADPLGVVLYGKSGGPAQTEPVATEDEAGPEGTVPLRAPMQGTVVALSVAEGTTVHAGQEVLILEAMKMQHALTAASAGIVRLFSVAAGDTVFEGHPLAFIEERADLGAGVRQQGAAGEVGVAAGERVGVGDTKSGLPGRNHSGGGRSLLQPQPASRRMRRRFRGGRRLCG